MRYTQLTQEERYQIYALMKAGHNKTEVSTLLERHKSTICREIRRSSRLRGCRPDQAQRLTDERKQDKLQFQIQDDVWF